MHCKQENLPVLEYYSLILIGKVSSFFLFVFGGVNSEQRVIETGPRDEKVIGPDPSVAVNAQADVKLAKRET